MTKFFLLVWKGQVKASLDSGPFYSLRWIIDIRDTRVHYRPRDGAIPEDRDTRVSQTSGYRDLSGYRD